MLRCNKYMQNDISSQQVLTLNCFAKIISSALTGDNIQIYLPCSNVVVTLQRHVQKSFIVSKILINFTTIVKHEHLTYTVQKHKLT